MEHQTLTHDDARHCFNLIGECSELWDDPDAWQDRLTEGVEELIGGFGGLFSVNKLENHCPETVEAWLARRNDANLQNIFARFLAGGGFRLMPSAPIVFSALITTGRYVWSEKALVGKNGFHHCDLYQQYLRDADVEDILYNTIVSPDGVIIGLGLLRTRSDRSFGRREISVLSFLTETIASRASIGLRLRHQLGRHRLTERQRETLVYLLRGYSEKKIATALGLSVTTVHEYVGAIYRKFGVHGRAELMAAYVNRQLDHDSINLD